MSNDPSLEGQIIAKLVENQISAQFDDVDQVNVEVDTDLLKIIQGKADSITLQGQGLTLTPDIRLEEIQVQTTKISLNPLRALLNSFEFTQPIEAAACVTMTEIDLNNLLNSDLLQKNLPQLSFKLDFGKEAKITLQSPMQLQILDGKKIKFTGQTKIHTPDETKMVGFTATIYPQTEKNPLLIESFYCHQAEALSIDFLTVLMQKFKQLISLPSLEWKGMELIIQQLQLQQDKITVNLETSLKKPIELVV
jgi:LmeA-like phospholipid-binding